MNTVAPPTGGGAPAAATVVVAAHTRAGCLHLLSELLPSPPLGMMTQIHMLLMVVLSLLACPTKNKACDAQLMRPGLRCDNDNSKNGDSNGDGTLLAPWHH